MRAERATTSSLWPDRHRRRLLDSAPDAARQLGVSIYELETFEADDASGSLELGVARDPVSATLASRSFELRPRYVMSGDGAVDESGPLWGRRDFLRFWDFWLSERDERFALEWRSEA